MYSYRDPNLKRTIGIYNKTGEFLENFTADEKAMTNYIIGAVNTVGAKTENRFHKTYKRNNRLLTSKRT